MPHGNEHLFIICFIHGTSLLSRFFTSLTYSLYHCLFIVEWSGFFFIDCISQLVPAFLAQRYPGLQMTSGLWRQGWLRLRSHSGHTASPRSVAAGGCFVNSTRMILRVWSHGKHDIVISVMFYLWVVLLQPGCVNKQR